jgi:hypothetical protein
MIIITTVINTASIIMDLQIACFEQLKLFAVATACVVLGGVFARSRGSACLSLYV